jgi:hypothetical protein
MLSSFCSCLSLMGAAGLDYGMMSGDCQDVLDYLPTFFSCCYFVALCYRIGHSAPPIGCGLASCLDVR